MGSFQKTGAARFLNSQTRGAAQTHSSTQRTVSSVTGALAFDGIKSRLRLDNMTKMRAAAIAFASSPTRRFLPRLQLVALRAILRGSCWNQLQEVVALGG